ncbi:hypothetical protein TUN199_04053 [Pyrenophora tritici-repentis]|nr:hypothetical protein Alg130_02039 [Pyrenophora tritici-repentis]KAI0611162.1 hypothetical protein TUN205_04562 [Pyrenophora tritici-repentis]KAI0623944.1 hypothetical protein TUN199_04053 [Pyrenophora tritici-repentis]
MTPSPMTQMFATTNIERIPAASPTAASTMLTEAFVTTLGRNSPSDAESQASNTISIYNLSFADRKILAKGAQVHICDHQGITICQLPHALFRAISTKKELVKPGNQPGIITLPENLDELMIINLIQHFMDLVTWKQHARMLPSYESTYHDLQTCSVGEYLGMKMYTQHIFNWYFASISSGHLPGYSDIDAFTYVRTIPGEALFQKLVNFVAKLDFEDSIPDPEDYQEYLQTNQHFREAVAVAKAKRQAYFVYLERKNREEAAAAERAANIAEKNKARVKMAKDKAAQSKAKWEEKKKAEAELAARVKAKMAAPGKKIWKAHEAGYIRRIYGKNVPT